MEENKKSFKDFQPEGMLKGTIFDYVPDMFQFRLGGTDHDGIKLRVFFGELGGIGIDLGNDPLGIDVIFRLVEKEFLLFGGLPFVLLFEILDKITGTALIVIPQVLSCDGDVHAYRFLSFVRYCSMAPGLRSTLRWSFPKRFLATDT